MGLFCEKGTVLLLTRKENTEIIPMSGGVTDWIRLNVGGEIIITSRETLCKDGDSMLAKMFGTWPASRKDHTGAFLLDLDPNYFRPILNYLRYGVVPLDHGVSLDGIEATARFLQVKGVLENMEKQKQKKGSDRKYNNVMILACRFASWIGLSGYVPKSLPQKFKFTGSRKYGNQWELFSHSNELVALILNDLISSGWWVVSESAGGAHGDISVYQSYLLANDDVLDLAAPSADLIEKIASGARSPTPNLISNIINNQNSNNI